LGKENVEENIWTRSGCRIRTNKELYVKYKSSNLVTEIKRARLRWVGHVERMPASRLAKKIYSGNLREGEKLGDEEQGGWTMWRQTSGKWDLEDGGGQIGMEEIR
jgi:hypothetical protein